MFYVKESPLMTKKQQERFWKKVDKSKHPKGCWLWTGRIGVGGYGLVFITIEGKKRNYKAHRISFLLSKGDPGGDLVLHKCDDPPCVRPSHLFRGDHLSNCLDWVEKAYDSNVGGPANTFRGEKHWNAKLKISDVLKIRELLSSGMRQRDIASRFQVSPGTISKINLRTKWRHIQSPPEKRKGPTRR